MEALSTSLPGASRPAGRNLHRFANPGRFLRLSGRVLPWVAAAGFLITLAGLAWGLWFSPPDWQQGNAVRIMYVHVPAAWLATMGYAALGACGLLSIVWRHPLADLAALEIGPVGAAFTAVCLISGSLWGKPMWGAWWEWDGRMTSTLVQFFLYLGYSALWGAIEDETKAARICAVLALVGAVNIPIIKFSVDWWATLHQGESIISGNLAGVFLTPFLLMMLFYMLLFVCLWLVRIRTLIVERRVRSLMQEAS
ncbi:MAG TPA: heme ABC transporter permease CcmC [Acidisoma sp.]|uniref:heme ABC transporter permease CcmC n=1 Tax=Acidisoma sp. TaxID=1872115 RepID=UPI002C831D03|nr:heme ABC transporter permease CcmC [Acidisoma sp.]HTI01834.1 heme ABC transporter permease CcmC [Acidisoma sp.]